MDTQQKILTLGNKSEELRSPTLKTLEPYIKTGFYS